MRGILDHDVWSFALLMFSWFLQSRFLYRIIFLLGAQPKTVAGFNGDGDIYCRLKAVSLCCSSGFMELVVIIIMIFRCSFYPFLQRLEVPAILSFPDLTEILNYILDIDT